MKLKADFYADWFRILRSILVDDCGYDVTGVSDAELPFVYFNAEHRRVDLRPRQVLVSDTFACPTELAPGWQSLKKKIEAGDDIAPNLSKLVDKLLYKDSLLNDWGVHHFYLGETLVGKFVDRTGPLLFAMVTNEIFYVIGVFRHGAWTDEEVVETIHRNWPAVVAKHRCDEVVAIRPISEVQCIAFRKNHINAMVETKDGTFYMPLGWGVTSSGYNVRAIIRTHRQKAILKSLQTQLEQKLENLKEQFLQGVRRGFSEVQRGRGALQADITRRCTGRTISAAPLCCLCVGERQDVR